MTLREKLELAGYRLRALALHMPTDWQKKTALGWADDAVRAASVGRNAERQDHEDGLGPKDEHAVGAEDREWLESEVGNEVWPKPGPIAPVQDDER